MPRLELPSGNWVEYRDQLKAKDRFAVFDAVSFELGEGSSRKISMGMAEDQRNMLLGRIITEWSYPVPVPSKNNFQAADVVIGDAMDIDDYSVLAEAVQPLMDKIAGITAARDPKNSETSLPSGFCTSGSGPARRKALRNSPVR